jgi:hypothetical protein
MFDPIVSRSSASTTAPGSSVSAFISAFREAGGHFILGQTMKWNAGNDSSLSDEALLMNQHQEQMENSAALAPIWIP